MKTFNRKFSHTLFVGLTLMMASSVSMAAQCVSPPICPRIYASVFGGWGHSGDNNVNQNGIAFFAPAQGGPLLIRARGTTGGSSWIAGANVGYEWPNAVWYISPAVELEGYYLRTDQTGLLRNPGTRLGIHNFDVSFPMNTGVFLVNGVFSLNPCWVNVYPYIGVGVGAATISISGARSLQVVPPEPGVNHFNGSTSDRHWVFAAQGKAGIRFDVTCNFQLLLEYRLLYLASNNYTFGPTVYPTHVPTTRFSVGINNMVDQLGVIGIQYSM